MAFFLNGDMPGVSPLDGCDGMVQIQMKFQSMCLADAEFSYKEKLKELCEDWCKAFVDYYMQNIHKEVSLTKRFGKI